MSKICEKCERGPRVGNTRSHSNIATKRWQRINIQLKKIGHRRMSLCTSCIKTITKKSTKA